MEVVVVILPDPTVVIGIVAGIGGMTGNTSKFGATCTFPSVGFGRNRLYLLAEILVLQYRP